MKKEEFQRMFDALQDIDSFFFEDFLFLVNDEGDVDFFEFRISFNSVSAIDDFFRFIAVYQDYEKSLGRSSRIKL